MNRKLFDSIMNSNKIVHIKEIEQSESQKVYTELDKRNVEAQDAIRFMEAGILVITGAATLVVLYIVIFGDKL